MRTFIQIILISICSISIGQTKSISIKYTHTVTISNGDLNKDGVTDKVVVTQDTLNEKEPYRLQIYFGQASGNFKLIVSSDQVIMPHRPNGKDGIISGQFFSGIKINKNILTIENELLRGHFEHKFRYQNGNFELIGYTCVYSNGVGEISSVDFNLSTGMRFAKTERYDTNEVISNTKKKILIRPLPKLQDVVPFEAEYY